MIQDEIGLDGKFIARQISHGPDLFLHQAAPKHLFPGAKTQFHPDLLRAIRQGTKIALCPQRQNKTALPRWRHPLFHRCAGSGKPFGQMELYLKEKLRFRGIAQIQFQVAQLAGEQIEYSVRGKEFASDFRLRSGFAVV